MAELQELAAIEPADLDRAAADGSPLTALWVSQPVANVSLDSSDGYPFSQPSERPGLRLRSSRVTSASALRQSARILPAQSDMVYCWCMTRTNIDIDDEACATVMRRYQLATKRDAINFALRTLAAEPLGLDEARKLRGAGWIGDLDEMRTHRNS